MATATTNTTTTTIPPAGTAVESSDDGEEIGSGSGNSSGTSSTTSVSLLDLAAASLAAAIVASEQIRDLAQDGDGPATDNTTGSTSSPPAVVDGNNDANTDVSHEDKMNVRLKSDGSYVTDADIASQHIIADVLHKVSDGIRLVGEESEEDMKGHSITGHEERISTIFRLAQKEMWIRYDRLAANNNNNSLPLSQQSAAAASAESSSSSSNHEEELGKNPNSSHHQETKEDKLLLHDRMEVYDVDPNRVSVFIDPLDGTKAYAKGDYDPVSVLIAIILDGTPCFGVICKPFGYKGQVEVLDTGCVAIYGGTLLGAAYTAGGTYCTLPIGQQQPPPLTRCEDDTAATTSSSSEGSSDTLSTEGSQLPRAVISSSRSKGVVQDFVTHLGDKGMINPTPLLISGAGEKSLRIILRSENEGLWFFPKAGTSLWDVAASDALLRATGGRLTDKNGNDMDYSKSRTEAENEDGVVACYDYRLHAECIKLFLEGPWNES